MKTLVVRYRLRVPESEAAELLGRCAEQFVADPEGCRKQLMNAAIIYAATLSPQERRERLIAGGWLR